MHPDPNQKRLLTDTEPMPAEATGRVAERAITTYEQLTRQRHPAGDALWPPVEDPELVAQAAGRVTTTFEATADGRDWTVPSERVRGLAADAIGLYLDGERFDYDREQAHAAAVTECLEGEAARVDVWPPPPEVEAPAVLAPGARAERAGEGGER
jgi:hypothetical protein